MLVCVRHYALELTGRGRLVPWIGPALRGLVAGRFRGEVCRIRPADRPERCSGCPHMVPCPYGQTFEPDAPPGRDATRGREAAVRPVVLAPHYPLPSEAFPGLAVPLRVLAVGEQATRHLPALIHSLARAGRNGGLGDDGVGYRLTADTTAAGQGETHLSAGDFPPTPDSVPGRAARVGVGLTAPLFLPEPPGDDPPRPRFPEFADLFRAALRAVGELFRLYAAPLRADFRRLREASESVRRHEHCFDRFEQEHWSSRGRQRYRLGGVVGGGVYADVPWSLIPWLAWGGRLHVGTNRLWGAGGWRILLD